jgi:hypothetical protein
MPHLQNGDLFGKGRSVPMEKPGTPSVLCLFLLGETHCEAHGER